MPRRWHVVLAAALAPLFACTPASSSASESAVIFMYHHVDRDTPPVTSVTPTRFIEHLDYLDREGFNVVPLASAVETLRAGDSLPEKAVVITFDDGYRSVLTNAAPELARRGWPFTVFVSTDYVDQEYRSYLSWDELRRLASMGATIGNHTRSHAHLVRRLPDEPARDWRARVEEEIVGAARRLRAEVGNAAIDLLAYPYGEYDAELKSLVAGLGLVALGQHSGAIGRRADWQALPRYPVASGFDGLDEFALRARTRPLTLRVNEDGTHVASGRTAPALEAVVLDDDIRLAELACYASGQGRMQLQWIDEAEGRFVARPGRPLQPGRTKYNCTAPSATANGVYHWFSYLWMTPNPDGSWYRE